MNQLVDQSFVHINVFNKFVLELLIAPRECLVHRPHFPPNSLSILLEVAVKTEALNQIAPILDIAQEFSIALRDSSITTAINACARWEPISTTADKAVYTILPIRFFALCVIVCVCASVMRRRRRLWLSW